MFDQAFYNRVDAALAALQATEVVTMSGLGVCLDVLQRYLREAEVDERCVRQLLDLVLDRVQRLPMMTGRQLAAEIRSLLADTSGLGCRAVSGGGWSGAVPGNDIVPSQSTRRWDLKELDNRLVGLNQASPARLRNAIGLANERPLRSGMSLHRRRCFQACDTMQVVDLRDMEINGEQVNRLIRYLGWGDSDSDPRGGRHAMLG